MLDNASTDGAPTAMKARHPDLTMLERPQNRGWVSGHDAGVEHALRHSAGLVYLLDNDTTAPAGTVAALAETAERLAPAWCIPPSAMPTPPRASSSILQRAGLSNLQA